MKKIASLVVMTLVFSGLLAINSAFADLANGKKLYTDAEKNKCASCHGDEGKGDGKKGKKLNPKPTDFTDAKTWGPKDGTDGKSKGMTAEDRMKKATLEGGPAVGQGKGMDAYKDLTPAEMNDLMEYMKSFKK